MPQVSVIIPTHNDEEFIAKAVDSVFEQTYENYEIIVIDDGSTDNTRSLLESYGDRIKYIYQDHQGVSAARNLGIEMAQSDLISFLDADDYFLPEHLQHQVGCLQQQPSLGMVSSGWRRVDEEGNLLSENQPWKVLPKLNLETWLISRPVMPSAMTIRKEWLEMVDGFNSKFTLAQDIDLILRLALKGCLADWSGKVTSCYRSGSSNVTNDTVKQAKFFDAVFDDFFTQNNLPESVAQLEGRARYSYLKWLGWRLYYTDRFSSMTNYLCKSLSYSNYSRTQAICDWIEYFNSCSLDEGVPLDSFTLSNLKEWKEFIQFLFIHCAKWHGEDIVQNWELFSQQNERFVVLEDNNRLVQENFKQAEDLSKKGKFTDAINYYNKALEIQPDNWNARYKLGYALFKNKMWRESIAECRKSIELKPDYLWSYYNLARSLEKLQQYDEAITSYLKAIDISFKPEVQRDLEALLNDRISSEQQKTQNNSISEYCQSLIELKRDLLIKEIEFKSNEFKKYQELGDTSNKNGKQNDALNYYEKAIKIQPDAWNIHQKMANILLKQKKWNESINECHKVIQLEPNFLWAHYDLGRNLSQIGQWREAIQCYFNALNVSYRPEVHQELELLLDEKIAYYQANLQYGLENLAYYQELLDIKSKVKVSYANKQQKRSEQILKGFSKNVTKKKIVICLMFGMKDIDYVESINFVLQQMYENKIYPIVFTDSVETELLFKNNVIFEYFPLSDKPANFSNTQWLQFFKDRVSSLVGEWSPQQVLNFNNTLNKEVSSILLSIM